jgi:hypothetical protein
VAAGNALSAFGMAGGISANFVAAGYCLSPVPATPTAPTVLDGEAMKNAKGKTIAKSSLPDKICKNCQKPFSWRKKWQRDWDQVTFCSDKCRSSHK